MGIWIPGGVDDSGGGSGPELVSFDIGTDEQISAIINAYYDGKLSLEDITNLWAVGDTRDISISAIATSGTYNDNTWSVGESHILQTVTLQILDFNHDILSTPVNGIDKALITVDLKSYLKTQDVTDANKNGSNNPENGYFDSWGYCWRDSQRRKWCNGGYYQALPEYMKTLVKPVNKVTTTNPYNSYWSVDTTSDYVFLLSEVEIMNDITNSGYAEGSVYAYYNGSSVNRIKTPLWGNLYYSNSMYWLRSYYKNTSSRIVIINSDNASNHIAASETVALSPAFCL